MTSRAGSSERSRRICFAALEYHDLSAFCRETRSDDGAAEAGADHDDVRVGRRGVTRPRGPAGGRRGKAPHHGSADFSASFLKAVEPVISVISSGDESSLKEYIHPRATLMGALGKYSREALAEPLIFVTELVAFFTVEGYVDPEAHKIVRGKPVIEDGEVLTDPNAKDPFFAFSRAAFGLVKVRTDGERLLVWTNSGQTDLKEAYAFDLSSGDAVPVALRRL